MLPDPVAVCERCSFAKGMLVGGDELDLGDWCVCSALHDQAHVHQDIQLGKFDEPDEVAVAPAEEDTRTHYSVRMFDSTDYEDALARELRLECSAGTQHNFE